MRICAFRFLSFYFLLILKSAIFVSKINLKYIQKEMKRNIRKAANPYYSPSLRVTICRIECGFAQSSGSGIKDPIFEDEESWN